MNVAASIRDCRRAIILGGLSIALLLVSLFALTVGAVSIPVSDVAGTLLHKAGLVSFTGIDEVHEVVLRTIRIPRILLTILIGAALGTSGASLQGLFRNPLVEPGLIGVSGGSAAAVVICIVFGGAMSLPVSGWLHDSILSVVAFAGGVAATFFVLRLSHQRGRTNIAVMVLAGVAMNALAGALIGLAIFHADENQLRTFTFWTLGDLGGASWDKLYIAGPVLIFSSMMLALQGNTLNALTLGEAEAFHLGVDTERSKRLIILFSALNAGVSVSMAGMIGFVGLVVPHVIRVSFYPDNRMVLPASMLTGGLLLLVADLMARTLVAPSELPIGIVTALIGAPFFIFLLLKAKNKNEL
ncbi:MAG TPA: iron ABC transporter permease [Ohtaekwangia sp.]|nr:iron ABC transporter permease [Ohtaekwangia sp.]